MGQDVVFCSVLCNLNQPIQTYRRGISSTSLFLNFIFKVGNTVFLYLQGSFIPRTMNLNVLL